MVEFLVNAVFELDAEQGIRSIETIGSAFSTLEAALRASVAATQTAVNEMIGEVGRLAAAWREVGEAARSGAGAGGGSPGRGGGTGDGRGAGGGGRGRGGGGGGGPTDEEREQREVERQLREDRMNADADNRNQNQIYNRQYQAAQRENADRMRAGQADDGISIPPPPRGGTWTVDRGQPELPPRNELFIPSPKEPGRAGPARDHSTEDMVEAAVGWELTHKALTQAGEEQQSIFRGVKAFNLDPNSPEGQRVAAGMQKAAEESALGTSYPETRTAGGIPVLARPFAQEGEQGAENFMRIYPGAAKAAEGLELMNPKNTFDENLKAMIEIAHQNREYDPQKLQHQYDVLGAITSMIPGGTFAGEAGAMSYVVPIARAAGANGERIEMQVGALQQAGLRGTIAATTLRQELVGLTKTGGPMQAHLGASERAEAREFENALMLRDPEAAKVMKGDAHVQAMRETGLLDAQGKDTFLFTQKDQDEGLGTKGGINLEKANSILAKWAEGKTPAEVAAEYYKLFGVRGEQAPALLAASQPGYVDNFIKGVQDRVNTPGGYLESYRDQASRDLINQQAGQASARFQDVLTHIGTDTLPMFQGALEHAAVPMLNWLAKQTAPDDKGNFTTAQTITDAGVIGSAAGALIGGVIGFFAGGVGAIPGAAAGAAIGGAAGVAGGAAWTHGASGFMPVDPSAPAIQPWSLTPPVPMPGLTAPPSPIAPNITVNLGPVSMQGIPDGSSLTALWDTFKAGLADALSHMTSIPLGSVQSAFDYAGGH